MKRATTARTKTHGTLSVRGLWGSYGIGRVVEGIDLEVAAGRATCLLGLNGMGKSTTLKAIAGLLPEHGGEVAVDGTALPAAPHQRARAGIAYVPEDRQVFGTMTVAENLRVAALGVRNGISLDEAYDLYPRLGERRRQVAGTLSGGEQQMLVIARALVTDPTVVMLDEPSEGLAPEYVQVVRDSLALLRQLDIGVLLVEQNFALAREACDSFVVLTRGRVVERLEHAELEADPSRALRHLQVAASS